MQIRPMQCHKMSCVLIMAGLNRILEQQPVPEGQYSTWIDSIEEIKQKFPMWYPEKDDVIIPQWAIKVLHLFLYHVTCHIRMSLLPHIC